MTSVKLGIRNLMRNRWRSGLTLAAVAVAVGLMVWTLAMYEGWIAQMVRGATAVEIAQVQVHTGEYMGIGPTGQAIAVEEIVVLRVLDGKITEEWGVLDFAALQQQLAAAAEQQ